METNLKKHEDPVRNYHALIDSERILTNGLGLILRGYNLVINI